MVLGFGVLLRVSLSAVSVVGHIHVGVDLAGVGQLLARQLQRVLVALLVLVEQLRWCFRWLSLFGLVEG